MIIYVHLTQQSYNLTAVLDVRKDDLAGRQVNKTFNFTGSGLIYIPISTASVMTYLQHHNTTMGLDSQLDIVFL